MSRKFEDETGVVTRTDQQQKLARPKIYKVIFHNDDFTTMEFVQAVLMHIYGHSETDATAIMLNVHRTGAGIAGIYPFAVAEAKVAETMKLAEDNDFPLLVTLEPEDPDDAE